MRLFEIKFRKLLSGKLAGSFRSFFKGEGLDIEDFRQYQVGDEPKHINWKLSAKHGNLFIKLFKQEKDTQVHVFFDLNSNWNGGENSLIKDKIYSFFSDIVIMSKSGSANVLGFIFANKLKLFEIKTNFQKAAYFISQVDKTLLDISPNYISNLSSFLKYQKTISKRHIIVIVSDFMDISDDSIKNIKLLSEKNELILVRFSIPSFVGINYDNFVGKFDNIENNLKFWDLDNIL